MTRLILLLPIGLLIAVGAAAHGPGMMMSPRHHFFMTEGVPEPYRGRTSPDAATAKDAALGRNLYQVRCARCHGKTGRGDGPSGVGLKPPPADLGHVIAMPGHGDDFFLWAIMEGGAAFRTGMPPFKGILTETEVWRIIAYMRAGFQ